MTGLGCWSRGEGEALPYVGHMGMCCSKEYGFSAVLLTEVTMGMYECINHFNSKQIRKTENIIEFEMDFKKSLLLML